MLQSTHPLSQLIKYLTHSLLLLSLLTILALFQITLFYQQYPLLPQIICAAILITLLFIVISQSTLSKSIQIFKNYKKYNKIRPFFQSSTPNDQYAALGHLLKDKQQKVDQKMMRASMNQSNMKVKWEEVRQLKSNSLNNFNSLSSRNRILQNKSHSPQKNNIQPYPKETYLQYSKNNKKFLTQFLSTYHITPQEYKISKSKIKESFLLKIEELLVSNQNNLKEMVNLLQKKYQIEVAGGQNTKNKSFDKSITITVDEAYNSLQIFVQKGFLRWNQRKYQQIRGDTPFQQRIQNIMKERRRIDHYLSPYNQLTHNQRVEIVRKIQRKKKNPELVGRQFVYILLQFYNEYIKESNVESKQKYYLLRQNYSEEDCLQFIETKVDAHHFHYNILKRREKGQQLIWCQPGQNNLWSCLNVAFYHFKLKK